MRILCVYYCMIFILLLQCNEIGYVLSKRLFQSKFMKSIVTFILNFKTTLLNISTVWIADASALFILFLFHVFVARYLDPVLYGLFASLYAFITVGTAVSHGFRLIQVKSEGTDNAGGYGGFTSFESYKIPALFGIITFTLIIVTSGYLSERLNSGSITVLVMTGASLLLLPLISVNLGKLQAAGDFNKYSFLVGYQAISRIAMMLCFVMAGFNVAALMLAVLISNATTFAMGLYFCRNNLKIRNQWTYLENMSTGLKIMCLTMILSLHSSVDVVIARVILDEVDSGNYAVITVLGRIVLYTPMAVTTVLFPKIIEFSTRNQNIKSLFVMSIVVSMLISLAGIGFLATFSPWLINILWGSAYHIDHGTLIFYCFAMFFLNINNVCMQVHVALDRPVFLFLSMLLLFVIGFSLMFPFAATTLSIAIWIMALNAIGASVMLIASAPLFAESRMYDDKGSGLSR